MRIAAGWWLRWLTRIVWAALLIFATVVIGGAVDARRRLPDLQSWHRYVPADATASDLATATLADYLRREDRVFTEVRDRIERTSAGSAVPPANRYDSRSRSFPSRIGSNGNRTYEIVPAGEIAGGAHLIRGLTDSPYSMRADRSSCSSTSTACRGWSRSSTRRPPRPCRGSRTRRRDATGARS